MFGKPKVTKMQMPIEDVAVIGGDLATFAIACIIGGASSDIASMTANNLLVREIQKFGQWKSEQKIFTPEAAGRYLHGMHIRIYEEFKQLAVAGHIQSREQPAKGESNGSGSGNQGIGDEAVGVGRDDSKGGGPERRDH